jgi:hypothetical protein
MEDIRYGGNPIKELPSSLANLPEGCHNLDSELEVLEQDEDALASSLSTSLEPAPEPHSEPNRKRPAAPLMGGEELDGLLSSLSVSLELEPKPHSLPDRKRPAAPQTLLVFTRNPSKARKYEEKD